MKFFLVLRRFQQDIATLPHGHGGGFMGEGQSIGGNILLKTNFFDSLKVLLMQNSISSVNSAADRIGDYADRRRNPIVNIHQMVKFL